MKAYLVSYDYYDEVIPIFATMDVDLAVKYRSKFNNILYELKEHRTEQYHKGLIDLEKRENILNTYSAVITEIEIR